MLCFKGICQSYLNYDFKIKGSASAQIEGAVDVTEFILPVGSTLKSCEIIVYHPNSYYSSGQNYQMSNNVDIGCTSSKFSSTLRNDVEGNLYTTLSLNNDESSDFLVYLDYDAETEVDMGSGFTSNAPFPTNINSQYTLPTTNIQSNDPDIISKAYSLTSGCTKMHEAVDKIAKWVIGSLQYQSTSNSNADMNASLVFERRTGNCMGYKLNNCTVTQC